MLGLKFNPFRSITFWGALSTAATYTWSHVDPSAFSPTGWAIAQGIAGLVGVIGLRNAVAKATNP